MLRRIAVLVCACLLLPVWVHGSQEDQSRALARFHRMIRRPGLDRKAAAVRLLDPNRESSLEVLVPLLDSSHWYLRGVVAQALSKVRSGPLRAELRLDLLTDKRMRVREGVALAFLLSPVKGDASALSAALVDDAWQVRRTAAKALAGIVSKESMQALVNALAKERDPRVALVIADTLHRITGRDLGTDAAAWAAFWRKHRNEAPFKGLKNEVKRRDLAGLHLETVTVAPRHVKGTPLDFFVLPPFGFTQAVYRPYLDRLRRYGRLTYVRLPSIRKLTGDEGYGPSPPIYPVGRLVKALEALRKKLGRRRVVVVASGVTSWIAERYAVEHPQYTAGLVLVNGYMDAAAYAATLARLRRSENPSDRWAAATLLGKNGVTHDRAADRDLTRIFLTESLNDASDSRGFLLFRNDQSPQGFARVPQVAFPPRSKIDVPTLFYFGANDPLSDDPDADRIRKHFPKRIIAVMRRSSGFPYVTEYHEFYRVLEGFLDYYGLEKRPKPDSSKRPR